MRDLLIDRGVDAGDIIVEENAEHTDENIYFSSLIMQDQGWRSAIVVSEERGQISICEGGTMTRDLDAAMLRKVLQRYFGARPTRSKTKPTRDATRPTKVG